MPASGPPGVAVTVHHVTKNDAATASASTPSRSSARARTLPGRLLKLSVRQPERQCLALTEPASVGSAARAWEGFGKRRAGSHLQAATGTGTGSTEARPWMR